MHADGRAQCEVVEIIASVRRLEVGRAHLELRAMAEAMVEAMAEAETIEMPGTKTEAGRKAETGIAMAITSVIIMIVIIATVMRIRTTMTETATMRIACAVEVVDERGAHFCDRRRSVAKAPCTAKAARTGAGGETAAAPLGKDAAVMTMRGLLVTTGSTRAVMI